MPPDRIFSTLLSPHNALKKRKYRLLYSPRGGKKPDPASHGPSWLTTLGHARDSLWSVDLFRAESITLKTHWIANLRVLEIEEIKSVPHVPMSHPFVERLIGSIRRELLDQAFFWTATDLENKLRGYQAYYNEYRCHSSRGGATPVQLDGDNAISLYNYRWKKHCRGLFQLPVAA